MLTNFSVIENYAIKIDDQFFDLHNNYDFVRMEQVTETDEIVILFRKSDGEWAAGEKVEEIRLTHRAFPF